VLEEMERHATSQEVQIHAVKSIGCLYDEDNEDDLAEELVIAKPNSFRAVVHTMARFPENMLLCQHCCFAISALVGPGRDCLSDSELIQLCVEAVLHVIRGDEGYPQKEACRAIIALAPALAAAPCGTVALQDIKGVREALENAVRRRAQWAPWRRRHTEGNEDGMSVAEHEEGLSFALTALGLVAGLQPVVATLENGADTGKSIVAKSAAQAIVELARLGAGQALSSHEAALTSTLRRGTELHWDVEVQRSLELAAGFCRAAPTAAIGG